MLALLKGSLRTPTLSHGLRPLHGCGGGGRRRVGETAAVAMTHRWQSAQGWRGLPSAAGFKTLTKHGSEASARPRALLARHFFSGARQAWWSGGPAVGGKALPPPLPVPAPGGTQLPRALRGARQLRTSAAGSAGCSNVTGDPSPSRAGAAKTSEWRIIKSMLGYLWPAGMPEMKARVAIAVSLLVGSKLVSVQIPFLFKYAVDGLNSGAAEVALLTCSMSIAAVLVAYGGARAGTALMHEARNAIFAKVAQRSIRRLAKSVFLHLHSLDLTFHLNRQTGALSRAIDRGTRGINSVLTSLLFNVVPIIFEISLVCGILTVKCGPAYAGVVMGCVGAYSAFTLGVTQWRTHFRVAMNKADNEAGSKAIDSLINYEAVKYYTNEAHEAERYDKSLAAYERASLRTTSSLAMLNWGQAAITSGALAVIMVMAANDIQAGAMSVGDLVMVNGLLMQITMPLGFLGSIYRDMRQSLLDMRHIFELMDVESRVSTNSTAPPLQLKGGRIDFNDISFAYPGTDRGILNGLSFSVAAGSKVAVVGSSGCGKSTILRMLFRFYDPARGRVSIDGQNISEVDIDTLRRAVGVVPQDVTLFNESIFYNIQYGRLDATAAEVFAAARSAHIHDTIMSLPQGYDTKVGERGLKLSGGEKQRVAIARAILKDPPILLFDEATSALDTDTESKIMSSMRELSRNRTSLFIAHRLSTIVDADEIMVLDAGHLVERGTHAELLKEGGMYATMWARQQQAVSDPLAAASDADLRV